MGPQQRIEQKIQQGLDAGFFTHSYLACGRFDEADDRFEHSFSPDGATIFDLASLTKALVTGPLAHRFLRKHGLEPSASLAEWGLSSSRFNLPSPLWQRSSESILGHFSGLPAWWNFWIGYLDASERAVDAQKRAERIATVLSRVPLEPPGQDLYSDLGFILLGSLLEQREGLDLNRQFEDFKFELAGAPAIAYPGDLKAKSDDFVPTGYCALRERQLRGEVHDENCASLGGIAGHAGLFSSGPQLALYLRSLVKSSLGHSYFEANWRAAQGSQREGLLGLRRGSGPSAALFGKGQSLGHLGFTGTAFWVDWQQKSYGIWLSNRVISGRVSAATQDYRRLIFGCFDEILA